MNSFKLYNINIFPGLMKFYDASRPLRHGDGTIYMFNQTELAHDGNSKYLSEWWSEFVCIDDWESELPENAHISKIIVHIPIVRQSNTMDTYDMRVSPKRDSRNFSDVVVFKSNELQLTFDSEQGLKEFKGSLSIALNKYYWPEPSMTTPDWSIYGTPYHRGFDRDDISNSLVWYSTNYKRPYFEFFYEYKAPNKPDGLAPKSDTINPRGEIIFTWNTKSAQQVFELQYRVNAENWVTVRRDTADRIFKLAANKISQKTGTVDWQVRIKDASGKWSNWATSYFSLGIVEQTPPIILSPKGDYVKSGDIVLFEWVFVGATSEKQQSFELQYTLDGTKWNTVKQNTDEEKYLLEDTKGLTSGLGRWKIKITNNFGETSEFTEEATFQIIGAPIAPQIISVSDNNFPTVKWNTKEQESYYLNVLDREDNVVYESGLVISYKKEHRVSKFLEPGRYTLELRTVNLYGISSEKMRYSFTISDKKIKEPSLNVFKSDYFIKINSDAENGMVERNGEIVGNISNGEYIDYTVANNKVYQYRVIKIENDDGANSKIKGISTHFSGNTICTLNNLSEYLVLKWNLDEAPDRSFSCKLEKSDIELIGNEFPYFEFGSIKTEEYGYTFVVDVEDLEKLQKINYTKEEVLFRDYYGKNIVGVLDALAIKKLKINKYQVSFKLIRTRLKYE